MRRLFVLACSLLLSACAAPPPQVLQRPATPSALLTDSASGGGRSGGAFFYLAQADGKTIEPTSLSSSLSASYGRGSDLQMRGVARYLPAGPAKLKLAGRYTYAAPIDNIFRSASSYSVEGTIDVDLRADAQYRIVGTLDAFRREVWLKDEATGAVVGHKIVQLADAAAIPAGAPYTCCNLHYDGDWISNGNWSALPMIPAGSRIVVKDYGSTRAAVEIEGRPLRIGIDYGREQDTIRDLIGRLSVKADPRRAIESFPKAARDAIAAGKVAIGMTKEEVLVALGHPRADRTRSIEADTWTYWLYDDDDARYELSWGPDRRLREVQAAPEIRQRVLMID